MGSNSTVSRGRRKAPVWAASALTIATLLLLPLLIHLDGQTHANWQQFLGRFHPLAVHLPIGIILTVPLLEIAARFRPGLREAAAFMLALAIFACISAVTLGFLLAHGSGVSGAMVTRHMWGGIWLTIGVLVCFLVRPLWISGRSPFLYPALLGCVVVLLGWASHQGGSLTHGKNYLTEFLPAHLKQWVGLKPAKEQLVAGSFYAERLKPILDSNCYACHSAAKTKGGLQLDSYALMMEGGRDGVVIIPGHPEKSLLFQRITLPPEDQKSMPAEGKPPLKPEEIAWIMAWILQGASPSAKTLAGVTLPEVALPLRPVADYSGLIDQIVQIEKTQSISLAPVSKNYQDGLILNAASAGSKFTDAQLAQLGKFAPYIVEAELGRTSVTDASFDTLAKFTNLRALHLEDTAVTGKELGKLSNLSQLTYLNLTGTKVTGTAIAQIASMKNLRHLYLYNTPAQPISTTVSPTKSPL